MKLKQAGIGLAIALALVGCNNNDRNNNNDLGMDNNNTPNHRYNNNLNDDGIMGDNTIRNDRNDMRDRNTDTLRDDNRNNGDRDRDYNLSKKAADRITSEVKDIDRAYVVKTGNTAYVAAGLDKNGNNDNNGRSGNALTDDVKKKIKDIVQSEEPSIDRVYVSTNPDFSDLLNRYSDDVNNGKPVRGFFDQIGNSIERLFPQNR